MGTVEVDDRYRSSIGLVFERRGLTITVRVYDRVVAYLWVSGVNGTGEYYASTTRQTLGSVELRAMADKLDELNGG